MVMGGRIVVMVGVFFSSLFSAETGEEGAGGVPGEGVPGPKAVLTFT